MGTTTRCCSSSGVYAKTHSPTDSSAESRRGSPMIRQLQFPAHRPIEDLASGWSIRKRLVTSHGQLNPLTPPATRRYPHSLTISVFGKTTLASISPNKTSSRIRPSFAVLSRLSRRRRRLSAPLPQRTPCTYSPPKPAKHVTYRSRMPTLHTHHSIKFPILTLECA